MKKLFTLFVIIALTISVLAQSPQKMSYQAVIRNASGELVQNSPVGMRISILQGSATGTPAYVEIQKPTTNANGLATIEIGSGTLVSGTFTAINWASGSYFLKTETDPAGGTSYTITGTSQLLSVPYALHSKTAESYNETDPVFGASAAKGITSGNITNWNTAYGWGNHAGLYKPSSYVPAWIEVTGKPAGFADGVDNVDDADNSITNEIQTLSVSNSNLTLSLGGGTVAIPGDNWGTQVVINDATLTGNGTSTTPLKIADNGITTLKILDGTVATADLATNAVTTEKLNNAAVTGAKIAQGGATTGQVLKWNGTTWVPSNDAEGAGLILPW